MIGLVWLAANAAAAWTWRRAVFARHAREPGWYLAIQTQVLVVAVGSLAAARARAFDALGVAAGALAAAAVVGLAVRARRGPVAVAAPGDATPPTLTRASRALPLVLVAAALLNAACPTYYLLGGRDPGIYLLAAVRIVRTGAVDFDLDPAVATALPAAYVTDPVYGSFFPAVFDARATVDPAAAPGRAIVQFLHLFSALVAHGFALGGLEGLVRANGLVAVLALWSVERLARPLVGPRGSAAAAGLLALSPAWMYAARITMPEVLAAALGLYALELARLAWRDRSPALALAAGLAGGLGQLGRLDAGIWVLAVVGFALAAAAEGPSARRLAALLLAGFVAGFAVGIADGFAFSAPYLTGQIAKLQAPGLVFVAAGVGAALLASPLGAWLGRAVPARLVATGAWVLVAWLAWGLSVRPLTWGRADADARAVWELSWYATPWGLFLAAAGIRRIARERLDPPTAALAVLAGGTLFVYTWAPGIYPDHPWASRRWVPTVIPLVAILALTGLREIARLRARFPRLARAVTPAAVIGTLAAFGAFTAPFVDRALLQELPEEYPELVRELERSRRPAVAVRPEVATVLTYYYDCPTLLLSAAGRDAMARGELDGVTLVGMTPFLVASGAGGPVAPHPVFATSLEGSEKRWPRWVYQDSFCLDTAPIRWRATAYDVDLPAAHAAFITRCGVRQPSGDLVSTGRAGPLLGGPYAWLEPGRYEVSWFGTVDRNTCPDERFAELRVDGETLDGTKLPDRVRDPIELAAAEHPAGATVGLLARRVFDLRHRAQDIELVVSVREGVELRLTRVRLRQIPR